MVPPHRPRHTRIPKDKFSLYFNHLKSQPYNESPAGRPPGPLYSIRSIAWNPVGSLVATGSSDKTLRVCESFRRFAWVLWPPPPRPVGRPARALVGSDQADH